MGIVASPWRPFFSVAGVIGLINSMVSGALAGVALDALAPRPIALIAALVVVAIAFAVHYRFGYQRFLRALGSIRLGPEQIESSSQVRDRFARRAPLRRDLAGYP